MKNLKKILVLFTLVISCTGVYSCEYKRINPPHRDYSNYSKDKLDAIDIKIEKELEYIHNNMQRPLDTHMRNVQMENDRREIFRRSFIKK